MYYSARLEVAIVSTSSEYLAGQSVTDEQLQAWTNQFDRDGYLLLKNVLPPDWCQQLRADLDRVLPHDSSKQGGIELQLRMFESSDANLRLFDVEPIVTLADRIIGEATHIIHNNSFRSLTGAGGITQWHQDDRPHLLLSEGKMPPNIKLPCLWFTANYYLTDVTEVANGGTECVRGSHLFGKPCPSNFPELPEYQDKVDHNLGPAGSVVLFNNQCWHRGGPNTSQRVRYITQITYARRMIGHKYFPFMNYQMPEHVYRDANPRLKQLLGFLPTGAYG